MTATPDDPTGPRAPISLRAYARHRGTSAPSVLRAIKSQRLRESLVFGEDGKPQIADAALADLEWDRNTDLSRAPGYVKERATAKAITKPAPVVPPTRQVMAEAEPPGPGESDVGGSETSDAGEFRIHDGMTLTQASAAEKVAKARLADLQYREKIGELVNARDIEERFGGVLTIVRTKVLGVPGKCKGALPHLTVGDLAVMDTLLREALEDLASIEVADPAPAEAVSA